MEQRVESGVLACIVNGRAGSRTAERLAADLPNLFRKHGSRAEVIVTGRGADLTTIARRYAKQGYRAIVAAGGDGTVNAVASAVIGTQSALGVLPMGTLNHFAKDAGIPLSLDAAVETIVAGHIASVDAAEVNGHFFVNNSSFGLYPAIVAHRSSLQRRGMGKWRAFTIAVWRMLRRTPHFHVSLQADGGFDRSERTPFVFVGNNPYRAAGFGIGARHSLDTGKLWVCTAPGAGRKALAGMMMRALLGRTTPGELRVLEAEELWISTRRRRRVKVANDGELLRIQSPLHYRIHPRALRVFVPAPG